MQNNNGVLDASETTVVATQTTGADGTYTFTEVYGGGYAKLYHKKRTQTIILQVIFLLRTILKQRLLHLEVQQMVQMISDINLINKITGTVFLDTDVDSLFDSGESGLSGVTVYLFEDTNNNGIIDASETTAVKSVTVNSDGTYNFDVIYTGGTNSYIVGTNESSYPAVYDLTTDNVEVASFTSSGNTDDNNDFGANSFNVITGMVFLDADVDANNDAGESGQESVVVYVYNDANNNGIVDASESTPVAIDTTDANGQYEIKVPYIGGTENYIISTNTSRHPDASSLTTDNTETATFTSSGNTDANNDYGYGLSLDNIIKGTVYEDLNGNGTFDSGESGQSGITVYLYKDAKWKLNFSGE